MHPDIASEQSELGAPVAYDEGLLERTESRAERNQSTGKSTHLLAAGPLLYQRRIPKLPTKPAKK